jgi:hypothetical protein
MRSLLTGVCSLLPFYCFGEPVLQLEDGVSWKEVFDAGIRPKHFEGLAHKKCFCARQSFIVGLKDRSAEFKVGIGRLEFDFVKDDFLSVMWHQGAEAMTVVEGEIQVQSFRELFRGFIVKEIVMPTPVGDGYVDAGGAEDNIMAQVGEYRIWYGFDNSFRRDKPLIPHFYVAWTFKGRPALQYKMNGDLVKPPSGYEWYSLDPEVNTPDSRVNVESPLPSASTPIKETREIQGATNKEKAAAPLPATPSIARKWWIGLIALLGVVGLWIARTYLAGKRRS